MYSTPADDALPADDGWDWPWILFIGNKELGYSEEQIWNMTPKKFFAMLNCAMEYKEAAMSGKKKAQTKVVDGTIDMINW